MDFQLINLLSKKGSRKMLVNVQAIRYTKTQAICHCDTQETHVWHDIESMCISFSTGTNFEAQECCELAVKQC